MRQTITRIVNPTGFQRYTAYRLPAVTPQNVLQVAATFGFKHTGNGYFEHPDGSWMSSVNGKVERGVKDAQFLASAPVSQAPAPVTQTAPPPVTVPELQGRVVGASDLQTLIYRYGNRGAHQLIIDSGKQLTGNAHKIAVGRGMFGLPCHPTL